MYRAALVQNTSEMLRYGWADIRPSLESSWCRWDAYTGEDIGEFMHNVEKGVYDAIVLATNACNDLAVLSCLEENKGILAQFLSGPRGLFISFQSRLLGRNSYGFLPDELDVRAIKRIEHGTEGTLSGPYPDGGHSLLRYPRAIDIESVRQQCTQNEFARNLYIGYLEALDPSNYEPAILDPSYSVSRALLLCSRTDLVPRVVITSLPLDWQGHDELLHNITQFVVQGMPLIGVLERTGQSSFDFRYLVANLRLNKIPFAEYSQSRLSFKGLPLDIHKFLMLDPAWDSKDIVDSDLDQFVPALRGGSKLYYFDRLDSGDAVVSTAGGAKNLDLMVRNALIWLMSKYSEGTWEKSFWTTMDVLETLRYFGYPTEPLSDQVLAFVQPHDRDGSYDEVLVASCALLKLYAWFLGREDERYQRCLQWIDARIDRAPLYELATVIETLIDLGEKVDEGLQRRWLDHVLASLNSLSNEFRLYRYAKTLHACHFDDACRRAVHKLAPLQDDFGRWINVPHTASIVSLLIELEHTEPKADERIERMTFNGILYVKENYTPERYSWNDNVLATAKALRAVKAFEEKISFPIDELILSLQGSRGYTRSYTALDIATQLNLHIQEDRAKLAKRVAEIGEGKARLSELYEREISESKKLERITAFVCAIMAPLVAFSLLLTLYVLQKKGGGPVFGFLGMFLREWTAAIFAALPLGPLIIIYLFLRPVLPKRLGGTRDRKALKSQLDPNIPMTGALKDDQDEEAIARIQTTS